MNFKVGQIGLLYGRYKAHILRVDSDGICLQITKDGHANFSVQHFMNFSENENGKAFILDKQSNLPMWF